MTLTARASRASRAPLAGLLIANAVSVAGIAMSALAIPWLAVTTSHTASAVGALVFAELVPYVLLQVLSGPVVDHVGARRVCLAGNILAACAAAVVPLLSALGTLHYPVLAAAVFVIGGARGTADCATTALLPSAAARADVALERAAGLSTGTARAGQLLGPPLAGVLVVAIGTANVVLVNACTFAASAVLLAFTLPADDARSGAPTDADADAATDAEAESESESERDVGRGYLRRLAAGLRFLASDRLLLGLVTMVAVTNLLDQGLNSVLVPVWIRDGGHSPILLGLITGAAGLGALLGTLGGAWLGPRLPRRATFVTGLLLGGAPRYAVLALSSAIPLVLTVTALAGCAGGAINPLMSAVFYERIPPHLVARVMGAVKASAWAGMPFGPLLAGIGTQVLGLDPTLMIAAAVFVAMSLMPLAFPVWREMRRPETA
ncbi:MFS transporter [Catenulispora sp. GP43]|uniref:MFS transporter n=1 Tax=Catenulispora sp. GP43 TaxID=3156263 RepID=UPI00351481C9